MHKLTIQLKQQTPLLHFQHTQAGATIRATEVKPKLDRFLIQKAYKGDFELYKHSLRAYKGQQQKDIHLAFAYQLSFTAKEIQMSDRNNLPGYFAEIGKKENDVGKKLSFAEGLQMHIKSTKAELLEVVKEYINAFFMQHNFGTRQSRGFGSFTVDKEDTLYKPMALDYHFEVENNTTAKFDQWKNLFNYIDLFARSLRAGLNLKGKGAKTIYYFKSLAFVYAKEKLNAQWDKKTIKENFFNNELRQQQVEHNEADNVSYNGKKLMVKDMFGLSTVESWRSYRSTIKKSSSEVQRFQSPILFKPVFSEYGNYNVHFVAEKVPAKMLNQTFNIEKGNRSFPIKTPEAFDFDDFFDYIFKNVDIDDHVDSIYHGAPEHDILHNIYTQLKEQ